MKKLFTVKLSAALLCALALGLWSCSDHDDFAEDFIPVQAVETRTEVSLEQVVFHEETGSWIRPQNDPYTLENFRNAYLNLTTGKSAQSLSKSQAAELSSIKLEATHYNVKIWPRTEKEQSELELMEDVATAYIPYDYVQLPESEVKAANLKKSADRTMPAESRYSVTYEGYVTAEGDPVETYVQPLPVMYAVWPCGKPFPDGMDYEILYEVCLPEKIAAAENAKLSKTSEMTAMQALENEAIGLALGSRTLTRAEPRAWTARWVSGKILHEDCTVRKDVPMANFRVELRLGSQIWSATTTSLGGFQISQMVPADAVLYFIFRGNRWKITPNNSTSVVTEQWGNLYDMYEMCGMIFNRPALRPDSRYEIHRAANHFF